MGIILNGSKPSKIIYNGAESALYFNGSKIWPEVAPDPPIPPPIAANTVRVRTNDGQAPVKGGLTSYETATLVAGTSDVYDVYKSGTSFDDLLDGSTNVVEVLGANLTGIVSTYYMFYYCTSLTTVLLFDTSSVTNMAGMFGECRSLTTVPLFDTSNVTDMYGMFEGCRSLTSIPLFDTSSVTNMSSMFRDCTNVETGALALYQQASTQATPPSYHTRTFMNCGSNTVTGAAELAQIPSGWK
jgi:surface protein